MRETIFTRLLKGEFPSVKVFEDDYVFAIMDAGQVNPGHVLVISKQPYETILEVDETTLKHMSLAAKKIAHAIQEAFDPDGITLLQTNKEAGWQTVPHIHIHVVPRYKNDAADLVWPRPEPGLEKLKEYAKVLQPYLNQ